MNKENRISTSGHIAQLIMLSLLVSVTCPLLLLSQDDPLLEPTVIAPAAADETDEQEAPVFVDVAWACEDEAVEASSSGGGGGSLIGGVNYVTEKMDGVANGESRMARATLRIPVAAVVDKEQGPWQVKLRTQMPIVDIPNDMPRETSKALDSELGDLKNTLIPEWGRPLTSEETQQLLSTGELNIELPSRFNKPASHWQRDGKVLLPIRLKSPTGTLAFGYLMDGRFVPETDFLTMGRPFVIQAKFDDPKDDAALAVTLDLDQGQPQEITVHQYPDDHSLYMSLDLAVDISPDDPDKYTVQEVDIRP